MGQYSYFLGIDISKDNIDWSLIGADLQPLCKGKVKNTSEQIKAFALKLLKDRKLEKAEVLVCLEQTGCYSLPCCVGLHGLGLAVWLEDPTRIKSANKLTRGKNDETDALKIAVYAARYFNTDLKIWAPLPEELLKLRELLTERERLNTCLSMLEVPMEEHRKMENTVGYDVQVRHSNPVISSLTTALKDVEAEINKLVNESDSFKDNAKILRSIPGVGPILTATLIKETDNFTRFTPKDYKQLACHAGVVPFEYKSGSSVRGRPGLSRKANKGLKSILHMSVLTSKQKIPSFKSFYEKQKAMGKPTMSVLNALRNKLLRLVMTLLDKGCLYEENYGKKEGDQLEIA